MRKFVWFLGLFLVLAVSASSAFAQGSSSTEIFAGYSYLRASVRTSTGTTAGTTSFNLHGGSASLAGNFNNWFGVVADFGAYRATGLPAGANATVFSYLFGPRISYRQTDRVTPFVHALFGGARLSGGSVGALSGAIAQNKFALALGGGVDVKVHPNVAIRLAQVEYAMTRFKDGGDNRQNNARISAGIVLRFGVK